MTSPFLPIDMYRFLLVAALLLAAGPLAAQSVPDWAAAPSSDASTVDSESKLGPGPPPPPPPPPGVPVDGGLALLALAGAGYAARRLREQKPE